MAQHFDLEEQEQLEQLKHFWNTWGTLITTALTLLALAFAGWSGYQYWQQRQARQATALADAVEQAVQAGDQARVAQAFSDLRAGYGGTAQAAQAGLQAAQVQADAGKWDEAKTALAWVAESGANAGYQAIARLRLAGVLVEQKDYDGALAQLAGSFPAEFAALVADRKADVLTLQDKKTEAIAEYRRAYAALDARQEYRRVVEAKLNALGARAGDAS